MQESLQISYYLKIGNHYISDDGDRSSSLVLDGSDIFYTNKYDGNYFSSDKIIEIPCLLEGKSLLESIHLYERYNHVKNINSRIQPHFKALDQIKMGINSAFDFIPNSLLVEFCGEILGAIKWIADSYRAPADIEHQSYAYRIAGDIESRYLLYEDKPVNIRFNSFETYSRYGYKKNSFPILSLKKDKRIKLKPSSSEFDFCEFDFNAFEIRALLALAKIEQPETDLYDVLASKQHSSMNRNDFKHDLIVKLYSNNLDGSPLDSIVRKCFIRERFPVEYGEIRNIFGKVIPVQEDKVYMSRLLMPTAAYILIQQVNQLIRFLKIFNYKSSVAFCVHDSVCLNLHKSEKHLIWLFRDILSRVDLPQINYTSMFPLKVKIGSNYGEMKLYEE